MEPINEAYKKLNELLRKVDSLISPMTAHHTIKWLQDPKARKQHFEKNPRCYLQLGIGRKHTLFPICNRGGVEDPEMIRFSLKLADKLYNVKDVDYNKLDIIVSKLKRLEMKLSKDIPKPDSMTRLKTQSTKSFNQNMK